MPPQVAAVEAALFASVGATLEPLLRAATCDPAFGARLEELARPAAPRRRSASRAGATKEEVAEAIGVTFLMQGGPATVYGPRAYDAFCEYYDAQHSSSGDAS